ncbi:MAG TPA: DUF5715 family protein [Pyrinomonadaceae bacterium]
MKETAKQLVTPVILSVAGAVAVWAALHFTAPKSASREATATSVSNSISSFDSDRWREAVEKVKADRVNPENVTLEVPPELRHYDDRHWFLATQVADVKKHNIQTCQDFIEVAMMLKRGEMVAVPAVTDDYVLLGVGARADDGAFTKYEDDQPIPLYDEAQLRNEYARLNALRSSVTGSAKTKSAKQNDKQKQSMGSLPFSSVKEQQALLDQYYNQPATRQQLFTDYDSLQSLARSFRGRSYDISSPTDRQAMKIAMLSSLRPEALKVLEEVAGDYHRQYDRPLPVSSLVRPEQYQHTLHRYNRAATTIDTPPHSTGLAFDIDYRYLSAGEQNFVMGELARMKNAGRIEVLRERNANFHVFVFIDGVRPGDDLITASLQDAGAPPPEPDNADKTPAKPTRAPEKTKEKSAKSKRRVKR